MGAGQAENLGSNSCFGTELVRLRSLLTSQVGITPHALQAQLETRSSVNDEHGARYPNWLPGNSAQSLKAMLPQKVAETKMHMSF